MPATNTIDPPAPGQHRRARRTEPTKQAKRTERPRYALYTRISRNPDGTSTAVARQEKECRQLCKERGVDIVEVFTDDDLSAWSGVRRPRYEDLLDAMAAGQIDGVIVWKLDRLVRRVVEFGRFWSVASTNGVQLLSKHDTIDTTSPIGLAIVYLIVGLAEQESFNTSTRAKSKERELAERGIHKHAGRRAYGLEPGWKAIVPDEAKIIQEAAERVLAGESVRSIIRDLNDRGVPAAEGGIWRARSLTTLLRSARIWGWREHNGEAVASGDWPAIISESTGRALRELLDRPSPADNRRAHLLSGILRCSRCGGRMKVGRDGHSGAQRYQCPPKPEGCNGTVIQLEPTNEAIDAMVLHRLRSPQMLAALEARRGKQKAGAEAEILAAMAEVERERELNSADRAANEISRETFVSLQRALDRRTEELSARLAEERRLDPIDALTPAGAKGIAARYESLPLERKRAVIVTLAPSITVLATDHPTYLERMGERLAAEAESYQAEATQLREQAAAAEDVGERARLRKAAEKRDADARRRLRQIANGGSSRNVFRAERLNPEWVV